MAEYTDLPFALVRPGHVWAAGIVLPVVCAILVSLRFYVRRSKNQRIGVEDWMSAIALVLVFGMGACLIVGVVQGVMGYPTPLPEGIDPQEAYQQSIENYEKIAKIQFYYQLIMIVAYGCIKVSLILFYRRLFVVTRWSPFDITCVAYLAFMVAWTLWLFLWFLWACRLDIDLHWAPLSEVEDRCGDPLAPEMALVISDLVTDLMILALPLPVIWRLQLRWRRKVTLSLVFLVGLVAIAASIARMAIYIIVTYTGLDAGYDLNRTITTMLWWSMIEACLGLMTCCLPILSGLLRHLKIGGWIEDRRDFAYAAGEMTVVLSIYPCS
ncbi:hypothetical protein BDW62DRAFT_214615 [Aspergillus aurantiobrunneus]